MMWDYATISDQISRAEAGSRTLQPASIVLALCALSTMEQKEVWLFDGDSLSDAQYDNVEMWVARAYVDLLTAVSLGGGGEMLKAILRHVEEAGTSAGSSSTSWTKRPINDENDPYSFVTLASDEFTPDEGVYAINARAAQWQGAEGKIRLYNVTQDSEVIVGDNLRITTGENLYCTLSHILTANGSDAYKIDHKVTTPVADIGMGYRQNKGDDEVYLVLELIPLSVI